MFALGGNIENVVPTLGRGRSEKCTYINDYFFEEKNVELPCNWSLNIEVYSSIHEDILEQASELAILMLLLSISERSVFIQIIYQRFERQSTRSNKQPNKNRYFSI